MFDYLLRVAGHAHFPLLHFPMVLFAVAALIALYGRRGRLEVHGLAQLVMTLAVASLVLTVASGLLLAREHRFRDGAAQVFEAHWLGGLLSVGLAAALWWHLRRRGRHVELALGALAVGLLAVGHLGGVLVHGQGYLLGPWVDGAESFDALDAGDSRWPEGPVPEQPDFRAHVWPIFERSCLRCHGATSAKGGLRLDTKALAFEGGDSGPVAIVPRDPRRSLVLRLSALDGDRGSVMPPTGLRLARSELLTLHRWIDQGAAWPDEAR